MDKPKNKSQQIKIEFDENSTSTEYSNFVVVTHSAAEFVLDYIRVLPGMAKAKVKSRIIMSPMHVKTLMFALQDNIRKYEDKFGEIKVLKKDDVDKAQFKLPDDVLPN
tara:strand:+ start:1257 stop:1580 length:324 start_codon:yes stop_codon:yes gene_type:complete